jgi:uncharacterized membrane protein
MHFTQLFVYTTDIFLKVFLQRLLNLRSKLFRQFHSKLHQQLRLLPCVPPFSKDIFQF